MYQGPNSSPLIDASLQRQKETFALLGAEQSEIDGQVRYRVGRRVLLTGSQNLRELGALGALGAVGNSGDPGEKARHGQLASGLVPIHKDHESLRIYGTSNDCNKKFFDFKMVIEDRENGLTYAEIVVLKDDGKIENYEGFLTHRESDPQSMSVRPLDSLSSTQDNLVTVHTRDGDVELNLGKVDFLIVDCGVVVKAIPETYRTQHSGDTLSFYLDGELANGAGEYSNIPITTLKQSSVAQKFAPSLNQPLLSAEVSNGYIAPKRTTGLSFDR